MSNQILQVDENMLETKLDRLVSRKVEELLNAMLDAEADEITGAARYERASGRRAYRAGHYERNLTVKAGTMTLRVPKLKGAVFESAVIERYRRREESVEEALIDMYLAGVSTRQVDDISRLLWGERMPSQTLSDKLKRVYEDIGQWRNRPLAAHSYPYLFVDGVKWPDFCSALIVRRFVPLDVDNTRFPPLRVSCSPGTGAGASSPRHETHRNVANSRSFRSAKGLRRHTSSVLYAPSALSAMALSYESPTVPADGSIPYSITLVVYTVPMHCVPWSLWWIRPSVP